MSCDGFDSLRWNKGAVVQLGRDIALKPRPVRIRLPPASQKSDVLEYTGDFMGKPRMVRSDKYRKRPVTSRYWACKDQIVLAANQQKFKLGNSFGVIFKVQMPKSWSEKKKERMNGEYHTQRPDLDNYVKFLMDSLLGEDSGVYNFHATKIWARENKIIVKNIAE